MIQLWSMEVGWYWTALAAFLGVAVALVAWYRERREDRRARLMGRIIRRHDRHAP